MAKLKVLKYLIHGLNPSYNQCCIQGHPSQRGRAAAKALGDATGEFGCSGSDTGNAIKDPKRRITYLRRVIEIKQHPFFEGINWALAWSITPPHFHDPVNFSQFRSKKKKNTESGLPGGNTENKGNSNDLVYYDFEYF
ncbi:hypothetical protein ZIOFF_032339 [Zingiber officinale]|uniref:Uncharacterized protein n=1 Tax=Zingiber officinale TaxID=94328 RepID=A0A8J5L161_ZINOF|nr:hypothetical protein ZIOFF_032339 [Zingiber officinale]